MICIRICVHNINKINVQLRNTFNRLSSGTRLVNYYDK